MFKNTTAFSGFSVPDMQKAKEFYGTTLDLDIKEEPEGLTLLLAGDVQVFIYKSDDYHAPEHTVLNFLVEDIDAAVDELIARGVHMEQYPEFHTDEKGICRSDGIHPGPKAIAWFKDPADHILAVIQEK